MKRIIKFRGVSTKTNHFVYGDYVCAEAEKERKKLVPMIIAISTKGGMIWNSGAYRIIPETLGQYIERNDITGKEIYEGDILACDADIIGTVEYSNAFCCFGIITKDNIFYPQIPLIVKVMGNIYNID